MVRGRSFDDGSAASSVGSDGQLKADNHEARKQFGKLDETEVISLLRSLYLKGHSDGRDDDDGRRSRSSCNRSRSSNRSRGGSRRSSSRNTRNRSSGKSTTSSKMRRGIFGGRNTSGGDDNRSASTRKSRRGRSRSGKIRRTTSGDDDNRSASSRRSRSGKNRNDNRGDKSRKSHRSRSERSQKGQGRFGGFFGGRNKGRAEDDQDTKPSKIQIPDNGMIPQNSFEYLNEQNPYDLPLGLHEDYYVRQHRMCLPPRSPRPSTQHGMDPWTRASSPNPPPALPSLQDLRNRPGFVCGEVVLQAEPVEAITSLSQVHPNADPTSFRGPHNTVQGQPVGPLNSLRGIAHSPIVPAADYESVANGGGAVSTKTPLASNLTRQCSPPGDVNAMSRPLRTGTHSPAISPPHSPRSMLHQTSTMLSPASNDAVLGASVTLPKQITVDTQREYVTANFGDHTLVSDLSDLRRDPWNHSPNSVMSQFVHDLEPNSQCCVRGSSWYDALHYACSRLVCDGRPPSSQVNHSPGSNPDYYHIDPKKLRKKTRRALEKYLEGQHR